MKHYLLIFLFFTLMLLLTGCNSNDKRYFEGDWEYKIVNNEAVITNYKNISIDVVVPANFGKYLVTEIAGAFGSTKDKLKKVSLPEGIKVIGSGAFNGCAELTDFIIPQSITNIKSCAFNGCISIERIIIPESVSEIGSSAFKGCVGIEKISIPKSVSEIGDNAFEGCTRLESVIFNANVNAIGRDAFKDTAWYNNQSDGVIYIGDLAYSFKGLSNDSNITVKEGTKTVQLFDIKNSGVKNISIPSSVTTILDSTFSDVDTITSIFIEDGLEPLIIENSVFRNCPVLAQINLPSRTKIIGDYAFYGCTAISELNLPQGTEKIGSCAFSYISALKSIIIPDNIEIGSGTFSGCIGLESVEIYGPETIPESMFSGCLNLENVVMHDGIIKIEKYAFYECPKLLNVTLPASINRIDSSAFWQSTWHEPNNLHFKSPADSYAEIFAYNHLIVWTEISG